MYESDARHAEIVIKQLELQGKETKPVATPGVKEPLSDNSPKLSPKDQSLYRSMTIRLNYLAQDRADLQHACKELPRNMSEPTRADWARLERVGRYLVGHPRMVNV